MFRHSPSRNLRSKGFKVKHVLYVCGLIAVFWLLYQYKHSHFKKHDFDESESRFTVNSRESDEILKLGRKDLLPKVEENDDKLEKSGEVEEIEDDPNEKEEEERDSRDDDITDEDELETIQAERDEEFTDIDVIEAAEEEEREEKESREKGSSEDDQDRDGGGRNTHEAREENYKGDDASSAVTHDTKTGSSESENSSFDEQSKEDVETNDLGEESRIDRKNDTVLNNLEVMKINEKNETDLNVSAIEEKGTENLLNTNGTSDSTVVTESNDLQGPVETDSNSTFITESNDPPPGPVEMETKLDSNGVENKTVEANQLDSNATTSTETGKSGVITSELLNSTSNSGSIDSSSNETAKADEISGKSESKNNTITTENENPNAVEGNSTMNENENENENATIQSDPIDTTDASDAQEEKEARLDLDTLPEIKTEGSNTEESAAERRL